MERIRLKLKVTQADRLSEFLSYASLFALLALPIYFYADMPDQIPMKYSSSGHVSSYGSKLFIWLMSAIGVVINIGLTVINRYPHVFNYPVRITEKNANRQYLLATRLIRHLRLIISLLFLYILSSTIIVSQGIFEIYTSFTIVFFLVAIFTLISYYVYQSTKKSQIEDL